MHTDIVEQIQKVMRESVESSEVTGVNLLVEKDDREIIYCQEGMADREEIAGCPGIRFSASIPRRSLSREWRP